MEFLQTFLIVAGLSFATVAFAALGLFITCLAFGNPTNGSEPQPFLTPELLTSFAQKKIAGEVDSEAHTRPNYVAIFATLLVLTGVTVALSRIDLGGNGNTMLAMGVATFKASLVALYFMHLKEERRLMYSLILIPMFFFAALFFGLMPDLVTNNYNVNKSERPGFGVGLDTVK